MQSTENDINAQEKSEMSSQAFFEKLDEIARRRGFFYISDEIYGGISGMYDYGSTGTLIKRNIEGMWRKHFLNLDENFYEIEAPDISLKNVFVASGHITNFVDPMIKCEKCGTFYRADRFIEENAGIKAEGLSASELDSIIKEKGLKCPKCKGSFGNVKYINMMFPVQVGIEDAVEAYLRPETAQCAYTNFMRQFDIQRNRLPMGLAIVGKAFRNEISPRQLLIRQREFTQAELQIFFDPSKVNEQERWQEVENYNLILLLQGSSDIVRVSCKEANEGKGIPKLYVYYMAKVQQFYLEVLHIPEQNFRLRELSESEKAFYNKIHFDVEVYLKSVGKFIEVGGVHYRTDHDLTGHQNISKKSQTITYEGRKFIPHVIELTTGVDRVFFAIMDNFYVEAKDREWDWFAFPPRIAPQLFAVFPLMNKEELASTARKIFENLRKNYSGMYDSKGSIGKRYARADEIGIPFSITIDFDTLNDNTVTIRLRNTTKQERVKIEDIPKFIEENSQ
ncbi:MAG: glycine--tRNA ligase [Candidatus Micrarchaeia archaeon]